MSTTECITQTSLSPTKSPNAAPARGARRHEQLRHADRQRLHRGRAEQRALGAAEAEHAVDAPVGEQAHDDSRTPSRISATAAPREPAARTSSSA